MSLVPLAVLWILALLLTFSANFQLWVETAVMP
jgi:hypothetical protein